MKRVFKDMTKEEALDYCYKYRNEYIADLHECGEEGVRGFDCLILNIESEVTKPEELPDYGMDYEPDPFEESVSSPAAGRN